MSAAFHLSDMFWALAEPLVPKPMKIHRLGGGRPRISDRHVLEAIFFVLRTGCQWKVDATGLGSGSTAHRRFQEWVATGFFARLYRVAAERYDEVKGIDWTWLAADGCLTKAPLSRSELVGHNRTDRGKRAKRSLLVDGNGIPLAITIAPANRNDHLLLGQTLGAVILERPDPGQTVQNLCLDKGCDDERSRVEAAEHGFVAHIRTRGEEKQTTPGKRARRWVVERTHAWMNDFRRLLVRWERKAANYQALLHFACGLLCLRAIEAA